MKNVEIIGYNRANLGKTQSKQLRNEGNVPCVVYGGGQQIHFYAPAFQFKDLVYTDEAHFVNLNIEGKEYHAILQDIQFHPVSEVILHADFLQLFEDKFVKMNVPVHFVGTSKGVTKGGTLVKKRRKLAVKALPKDMPDFITVDITNLDFHKALKVGSVQTENYEIQDSPIASIAVVEVPRALRGKMDTADDEAAEGAETEGETEA